MPEFPKENVHGYPRPPRLEPVGNRVVIRLGGKAVADTICPLRMFETRHAPTYYLPPPDVRAELHSVAGGSRCEWKRQAQHFGVFSGGMAAARAVWSYLRPNPPFAELAARLVFYPGLMEACFVGGERVSSHFSDFYGGWVTANLAGRPKGAPGTRLW